jgi:hypothetical protein
MLLRVLVAALVLQQQGEVAAGGWYWWWRRGADREEVDAAAAEAAREDEGERRSGGIGNEWVSRLGIGRGETRGSGCSSRGNDADVRSPPPSARSSF